MKRKSNIILGVLCCTMCLFPFTGCGSTEPDGVFDETNVVLSFSAFSDIHQQKNLSQPSEKLIHAFDFVKELNGGEDIDVAVIAGDLTEWTYKMRNEDYSDTYNVDIEVLKETLEHALNLDKTNVFYALGNHDSGSECLGREYMSKMPGLFYRMLGEKFFAADTPDSDPESGRRHAVVNGYHFLSVEPDTYWTAHGYSDETLEWLESALEKITRENPRQYVFIVAHPPLSDTVFLSRKTSCYDSDVRKVLENYPQTIYFSGHVHNVLQDETQISQDGFFTAMDCGSVKYTSAMNSMNEFGKLFDNSIGSRTDDFSQGLFVQADGNGNVRVTRCDFVNDRIIKQPWDLPRPKKDNSHLDAYDNQRRKDANVAPVFSEEANVSVREIADGISFQWDAATDDDMVRYYTIKLYSVDASGKKEKYKTYNMATFTYLYDSAEDMPKRESFTLSGDFSGDWYYELTAVDVWNAESAAVTGGFSF